MPDYNLSPDFQAITLEDADGLLHLVGLKQRLMVLAATELEPLEKMMLARTYMRTQWELLKYEEGLGKSLIRIP